MYTCHSGFGLWFFRGKKRKTMKEEEDEQKILIIAFKRTLGRQSIPPLSNIMLYTYYKMSTGICMGLGFRAQGREHRAKPHLTMPVMLAELECCRKGGLPAPLSGPSMSSAMHFLSYNL